MFNYYRWFLIFTLLVRSVFGGGSSLVYSSYDIGVRAAGLGGEFVAVADDVSTILANPAGLSRIKKPQFLFFYFTPYQIGALRYISLLGAQFYKKYGGVGGGWRRLEVKIQPRKYMEDVYTVAWGYPVQEWGAIGAKIKYHNIFSDIIPYKGAPAYTYKGFELSLGALFPIIKDMVTLGVNIENIYSSLSSNIEYKKDGEIIRPKVKERHPLEITLGICAQIMPRVLVALEGKGDEKGKLQEVIIGGEGWILPSDTKFKWFKNFALRAGIKKKMAQDEEIDIAAGCSIKAQNLQLNYAYLFPGNGPKYYLSSHKFSLLLIGE